MNSFLFNVGLILLCSIRLVSFILCASYYMLDEVCVWSWLPFWRFVEIATVTNVEFLCFSVIQFCSTAFAYYAQATAAQEIFGHTLQSLRGIRYLYKWVLFFALILIRHVCLLIGLYILVLHYRYNVFQIAFIVLAGLTFVYYAAFVRLQTIYSC